MLIFLTHLCLNLHLRLHIHACKSKEHFTYTTALSYKRQSNGVNFSPLLKNCIYNALCNKTVVTNYIDFMPCYFCQRTSFSTGICIIKYKNVFSLPSSVKDTHRLWLPCKGARLSSLYLTMYN